LVSPSPIGALDAPNQNFCQLSDGNWGVHTSYPKEETVMTKGYVYILASKRNGTLYTGMTTNLYGRMVQHRSGEESGFAAKYGVTMLVWFEEFDLVTAAIQRETNIKRWKRRWKLELIEEDNPEWRDLFLEME
jgi:putative endonuclease